MTDDLDTKLLRFADGEMTPEEEACVLLDCEEFPEQWKDLALSLVAQRRLVEALAEFDDPAPGVQDLEPSAGNAFGSSFRDSSRWYSAIRICGMSLALLLAFLIGRQQTSKQQPVVVEVEPSPLLLEDDDEGSQQAQLADLEQAEERLPMTRQVQAVNPWTVVSKPVITEEDRMAFSDAGLDVVEENTIYIINDADGGQWAIPWKAVDVRYSAND